VVGESAAVRGAIRQFIDRTTSFEACCESGHGSAAVDKAIERAPDLVILDLSTPTIDGVEIASALRRVIHGIKIIGLAKFPAKELPTRLITSAGFDMIVSKHEGLRKLAEAINALLREVEPQIGVGEALPPPFAIFKIAADGHPVWVQSAQTLDEANARVQALGLTFPGEYIIRSRKAGHQTVVRINKTDGNVQ